ncbi:ATP-binding protein [Streptomyces sp. NPDC018019]|uniref:ATP-binding protein n=1 Tax=Streptomyces sp. NPDC018019 TaxID=3365030 RepID=UPI0037978D67
MSGGWEYAFEMSDHPRAPRVARRVVRLVLEEHGETELADGAELLASELIANSHRYAQGPANVRVKRIGARLRVSVWDGNPELPIFGAAAVAGPAAEAGRGLGLVRLCAESFGGFAYGSGALGSGGGKVMWFELGEEGPLWSGGGGCALG